MEGRGKETPPLPALAPISRRGRLRPRPARTRHCSPSSGVWQTGRRGRRPGRARGKTQALAGAQSVAWARPLPCPSRFRRRAGRCRSPRPPHALTFSSPSTPSPSTPSQASPPTSSASSLRASSWRTAARWRTTTSRRSPPCTLSSACGAGSSSPRSRSWHASTTRTR